MNNPWIKAARLRTLPLAISGILLGWAVAFPFISTTTASWGVLVLAILTAIFLQITSNYANDYGDFQKGTDQSAGRTDRMLTTGEISPRAMKIALIFLCIFTLLLGLLLLLVSGVFADNRGWILLMVGISAIAAAILYTVGKHAYGYRGLGDLFVFLFFGVVTVLGMALLLDVSIGIVQLTAAFGMGSLSTAVLNINNYRDIETDKIKNKRTLAVVLGVNKTLVYHGFLLLLGIGSLISSFVLFQFKYFRWDNWLKSEIAYSFGLFFPIIAFVGQQFSALKKTIPGDRELINPLLKRLSLTIFATAILFCFLVGFIVS